MKLINYVTGDKVYNYARKFWLPHFRNVGKVVNKIEETIKLGGVDSLEQFSIVTDRYDDELSEFEKNEKALNIVMKPTRYYSQQQIGNVIAADRIKW